MSVLDTLAKRMGYTKQDRKVDPLLQATGTGQAYTLPDLALPEAQEELLQRLSWVYGAVMAVAKTAAGAQLNVLKLQGEKRKDIPNHDLEMLLLHPNPLDSRSELMVKTVAYRALTGNAYWWLNRTSETATPDEIWVLPSHQVTPIPDGRMFIKGYTYEPGLGEEPRTLPPWQVVHFKDFHPRNWFVGLSPIEALATVAQGDLKAQQWQTNFFGKDNAKPGGALAFSDMVSQDAWDKLKQDLKDQWGGTNRSGPLLLRGVGDGGVTWVSMSMSQKDMEFLASRTFTKEEVYSIYAPGLASVLAVNATEANAKSGKATFIEMAVWPILVSIGEKITNNVLPVYGEKLVAEFDDLRVVDRLLELQEQEKYSQVHTIDEIRERYYEDKPLGDDRGLMLVAQINPQTPSPSLEGPDDENAPPPLPPLLQAPGQVPPEDEQPEMQPMDEMGEEQGAPAEGEIGAQTEALAAKELSAWRRYALRHGRERAQAFVPEYIAAELAQVIRERLAAATSEDEVKAAFVTKQPAPAAKDDDERQRYEQTLAQVMDGYFAGQMKRVARAVRRG